MVIDDEPDFLRNICRILKRWHYECIPVADSLRVGEYIRAEQPDIVITDLKMPQQDGFQVLQTVQAWNKETPVIVLTAYGSISSAVKAMKAGAYDYLTKPFNLDELRLVLERAAEQRRLKQENQNLHLQLMEVYGEKNIIAVSENMLAAIGLAKKVACTETTVLITGESGTGKELLARFIHTHSLRSKKPFIPFDCTTLPENLMETELFGYQKGAFTGAVANKPGIIEIARGGTLFLDEIGELPLNLQAKLLRVLQEHQYRRVGGNEFLPADVRFIAATNRNLEQMVAAGQFRADLFYRLHVFPIKIPPLRERPEDIPVLATRFLQQFARQYEKTARTLSPPAQRLLEAYPWPGNVRELQNVIERAVLLAEGEIIYPAHLPSTLTRNDSPVNIELAGESFKEVKRKHLEILEQEYFTRLLKKHRGNITRAAVEAGVNRRTIHRLIKKYNLKLDT
ncbi:Signal transduction response regulator, receiver domain [Moorella glycerini]|uniref:Stage 0 sporulation protein A homolog n=2 Tax=Neomoorella stamsii TaxID=1266720 RepID=A0A9X7J3U0_9FIRM|nr:Transcriptional regulatory protein ZraR [Moorella stamsii]CEP66757.1 Signal transduction response regulator, receiver domain [Moorella glycerini]